MFLCSLPTELGSHFIDQGIGVLCQGIGIYSELFKRSGLQDRKALELAISKSPNDVKAAALELLEVEDDWNEFLSVVEASDVSRKESSIPEIGDKIPSTVSLYRVCDGVSAQDTSVGTPAAITLAELLESSTQSATLSVGSVWNTATLSYYGAQVAKGISLPQAYTDIKDDPHQMGGDFLLNKHSQVQFIYRSKVPIDEMEDVISFEGFIDEIQHMGIFQPANDDVDWLEKDSNDPEYCVLSKYEVLWSIM
ncbi:uncharacterized protein [Procambarus clarkii]|uniref:uncharacterized protein n=1 Tax=Procambarus clarkii TaxID=6728 RepID=UPI003742C2BD